jgi:hypothetical protein
MKSFFSHPATIGAGVGGLGGAGLGYLSADDPELRGRGALVGAGVGAGIGGLAGALAVPPPIKRVTSVDPRKLEAALREAARRGSIKGQKRLIGRMPTGMPITDEVKQELLEQLEHME